MNKDIIIIGAGGHAKVIAELANLLDYNILGFLDDSIDKKEFLGKKVIGKISDINNFKDYKFVIGIGSNLIRKEIDEKYSDIKWSILVHPSAVISNSAAIEEGTVIMANSVINASSMVGRHCIINTGSIIEHDNKISSYVHVSPRVALGGNVIIEEGCHLGIGSTVINNVYICSNCIIGAGGVVINNIVESGTYVGIPVRRVV